MSRTGQRMGRDGEEKVVVVTNTHTDMGTSRDDNTMESEMVGSGSTYDTLEPSVLVDNLLEYTESLMATADHHMVAYSGGIDSSLVLALLLQVDKSNSVQAVLGLSPAVPQEQIDLARSVASHLQAPLVEVHTDEGSNDVYIENAGQACFACKTHLYSSLEAVLNHTQQQHDQSSLSSSTPSTSSVSSHQLYNGTNADDTTDPTRVGLIAARNFSVLSPLEFTTKHNVRRAARYLGLPNWNVAASPCLRSRLALGVEATRDHLERIERAERLVRKDLANVLDVTSNLRVRMLTNQRARVEVDGPVVQEALEHQPEWDRIFVQELGFASVQVAAFKSGSVSKS